MTLKLCNGEEVYDKIRSVGIYTNRRPHQKPKSVRTNKHLITESSYSSEIPDYP